VDKNHLQNVGLSYFSHLKFALGELIRLFGMAIVLVVHGFIPWIWSSKYSDYISNTTARIRIVTGQYPLPRNQLRRERKGDSGFFN
jgi:hypothetical protein